MSSDHPWVLKVQEALAAGQAGDAIASDDPYVRMLLAARGRSQRSDLVSIRALAAEMGVSVRTLRRRNNHPDAPNGYSPTMSFSFATKSGSRPMLHVRSPVHVTSSAVSTAISTSSASNSGKFGGGAEDDRPSASTACISIRRSPSRSTASSATPCKWDNALGKIDAKNRYHHGRYHRSSRPPDGRVGRETCIL